MLVFTMKKGNAYSYIHVLKCIEGHFTFIYMYVLCI